MMARTLRELIRLKEEADSAALASLLLLATLERRIPETHLPVAELEREEHQTRTALRAVREARATDLRALTLIAALEEQHE